MEHRWGIRRTLDVGVKLYVQRSSPRFGRLLNASSSGAYVATGAALPIMTRVRVALGWGSSQGGAARLISAFVVRTDARGIGIEWQKFAPPPLRALIDTLEMQRPHTPASAIRVHASRAPTRHYGSQTVHSTPPGGMSGERETGSTVTSFERGDRVLITSPTPSAMTSENHALEVIITN